MNRRGFLKAAAGAVAAAFVVPEVIVPERRVWALDSTMIRKGTIPGYVFGVDHPVHYNYYQRFSAGISRTEWMDALEPWDTPMLNLIMPEGRPVQGGLNEYVRNHLTPDSIIKPGVMEEIWDSLA